MKVRVYDKSAKRYFKSEVYAIINGGYYERHLVRVPDEDGGQLCFFDCLDQIGKKMPLDVLVNTVVSDRPKDWVYRKTGSPDVVLPGFGSIVRKGVRFFEYIGYPWLFDRPEVLSKLINGESVAYTGSVFEENRVKTDLPGWTYVESLKDIDHLMEKAYGFHDSVLKSLCYTSGAYVDADKCMYPEASLRQLILHFDSQWCDSFELVFEGLTALNLRPSGDNEMEDIYSATLLIRDEAIFFCDEGGHEWSEEYEGTWVTSYGLRWRFIEKTKEVKH